MHIFVVFITTILAASFVLIVLRGAPFVPSQKKYIKAAFEDLYKPNKDDILFDIGSGDGAVLKQALSSGFKKVIGWELNPFLVVVSLLRLNKDIRSQKVQLACRDFLISKLPDGVTIFYCFGVERFVQKAIKKIEDYSNDQQREVYFMSLAFKIKNREPQNSNQLYYLYKISPCKKQQP